MYATPTKSGFAEYNDEIFYLAQNRTYTKRGWHKIALNAKIHKLLNFKSNTIDLYMYNKNRYKNKQIKVKCSKTNIKVHKYIKKVQQFHHHIPHFNLYCLNNRTFEFLIKMSSIYV